MNASLPRAATAPSLAIERIRHPLQGRHLQVVRRTPVSPGFVRLTLSGPELAGFASAGFDDHLKLMLPARAGAPLVLPEVVIGLSLLLPMLAAGPPLLAVALRRRPSRV